MSSFDRSRVANDQGFLHRVPKSDRYAAHPTGTGTNWKMKQELMKELNTRAQAAGTLNPGPVTEFSRTISPSLNLLSSLPSEGKSDQKS